MEGDLTAGFAKTAYVSIAAPTDACAEHASEQRDSGTDHPDCFLPRPAADHATGEASLESRFTALQRITSYLQPYFLTLRASTRSLDQSIIAAARTAAKIYIFRIDPANINTCTEEPPIHLDTKHTPRSLESCADLAVLDVRPGDSRVSVVCHDVGRVTARRAARAAEVARRRDVSCLAVEPLHETVMESH
jgi:hypothetical protein